MESSHWILFCFFDIVAMCVCVWNICVTVLVYSDSRWKYLLRFSSLEVLRKYISASRRIGPLVHSWQSHVSSE